MKVGSKGRFRMNKHEEFPLVVIAGPTQIGGVEERRLAAVFGGGFVVLLAKEGRDALAIERAEFEGEGRDRLDVNQIDAPIRAQDAKAGPEAIFGMRPAGQHCDDQRLGARPILAT
jgi:hypothetical protein